MLETRAANKNKCDRKVRARREQTGEQRQNIERSHTWLQATGSGRKVRKNYEIWNANADRDLLQAKSEDDDESKS